MRLVSVDFYIPLDVTRRCSPTLFIASPRYLSSVMLLSSLHLAYARVLQDFI